MAAAEDYSSLRTGNSADEVPNGDAYDISPQNGKSSARFSVLDTRLLASAINGSPGSAKRALEAHMVETDRRIRDASKLGTNLLEQKRLLAERLNEVGQTNGSEEIDPELKQKLEEVEREYNELGKESARLSMSKSRKMGTSIDAADGSVFSGDAFASPSKPSAPLQGASRKQRNTSNRVEDLAFATEISTSLLGQVRQLQNTLAEKEEALRRINSEHSSLQADAEHAQLRLRSVLDNEQRYKDENWHLETQVQELSNQVKDSLGREQRTNLNLSNIQREKSTTERDFDELRLTHSKLADDHTTLRKKHDTETANLRRNVAISGSDRDLLQKKIADLTSQNEELARAVAYRMRTEDDSQPTGTFFDDDDEQHEESTLHPSPPPSPTKGTPRHGALESETLKSSLHHAHRMIQNLKNNIHREKTEKLELRRMLQDARDEVESSRAERGVGAAKRKKQTGQQDPFRRPARPDKLGSRVGASEEIVNDPSWEEYEESPTKQALSGGVPRADLSTDASDAFDTANENEPSTESDAFETAGSVVGEDSEGDATETETTHTSSKGPSRLVNDSAGRRASFLSTASSDEDSYDLRTPPRNDSQQRPVRMSSRGVLRQASGTPGVRDSPASFVTNSSQATPKQDLAAELEDFDDDTSLASGTPSRSIPSNRSSPEQQRKRETQILASDEAGRSVPQNMDSTTSSELQGLASSHGVLAAVSAGAAMLGAGLVAAVSSGSKAGEGKDSEAADGPIQEASDTSQAQSSPRTPIFGFSSLVTQHTRPIASAISTDRNLASDTGLAGAREIPRPTALSLSDISSQYITPGRQSVLAGSLGTNPIRDPLDFSSVPATGQTRAAPSLASVRKPTDTPSMDLVDGVIKDTQRGGGVPPNPVPSVENPRVLPTAKWSASGLEEDVFVDHEGAGRDIKGSPSEVENASQNPRAAAVAHHEEKRIPFQPVSGNGSPRKLSMADEQRGDQGLTAVDGEQTLRDKGKGPAILPDPVVPAQPNSTTSTRSKQSQGVASSPAFAPPRSPNRPGSAGGIRNRGTSPAPVDVPPLPADHKEVIAAASRTSSMVGTMPPLVFSSPATKVITPRSSSTFSTGTSPPTLSTTGTPSISRPFNRPPSVTATSNRPPSVSATSVRPPSVSTTINRAADATSIGRQSSISSFASEIDDRFHRQAYATYGNGPFDMTSTTDPRMIQAITQTMIGEFMWKYTRKTGRGSSHSDKRHKRFFWIHPYTRTLYWSVQDPARSGHGLGGARQELKAKSVPIEAVRVVSDENPHPPGLCNKSIVIVTPSRSIKMTAPTSVRHETWFNALSYLLVRNNATDRSHTASDQAAPYSSMRSSAGRQVATSSMRTSTTAVNSTNNYGEASPSFVDNSNTLSSLTSEDISEFNPTLHPRPSSRMSATNTGSYRSTPSYSSLGQRASASLRNRGSLVPASPSKTSQAQSRTGSLAGRQSAAVGGSSSMRSSVSVTPTVGPAAAPPTTAGSSTSGVEPSAAVRPASRAQDDGDVDADGFRKPAIPMRNTQRPESVARGSLSSRSRAAMGNIFRSRSISRVRHSDAGQGGEASSGATSSRGDSPSITSQETLPGEGHERGPTWTSGSGTVENVRACCDGKHDVGDLSHTHTHKNKSLSLSGRNSTQIT